MMKFAKGDKVKVVDNTGGHRFTIGLIGVIDEVFYNHYKVTSGFDYWYLNDDELELHTE